MIKVSPSGTSTEPGTDPGTKPGEESDAKDLTASATGVSISLTDGVPEGAELYADTIAQESVLGSRPELKEELPGLLSIYEISVRKDGKALEIKDNPMTVKIPMNDHLKGYKYYQMCIRDRSIYDISVRQNGETLEIKDNPMTVKIPLNDHLKGYK